MPTANWPTLHPNEEDLPNGGYVQDRLAAARLLQEKAGPLLADSPILVNIHFLRDNLPGFFNQVLSTFVSHATLYSKNWSIGKYSDFEDIDWRCLE